MTAGDAASRAVLIYATFPSAADAERIGGGLVERGVVACVNILPAMTSIYVWEGALQRESEVAMIVKTRGSMARRVVAEIASGHPYSNPAIVVLPLAGGAEPFLAWIETQTARAPGGPA